MGASHLGGLNKADWQRSKQALSAGSSTDMVGQVTQPFIGPIHRAAD